MAPITRICSTIALLLCAASVSGARPQAPSALSAYVQARVAEADEKSAIALKAYAAALAREPDNTLIALRACRLAIESGDGAMAVRTAEMLSRSGALPPDIALLLVGSRLKSKDTAGAAGLIDRLEQDKQLLFLVPVLRSWVGLAAGDLSATAQLGTVEDSGLGPAATLEQRALADLISGRTIEALSLIRSAPSGDLRTGVTRITAAATLQKMGDKTNARALLKGNDPSFVVARQRLDADRPLGGAVDTPQKGVAFFYARLATDLVRDNAPRFAMTLARYARFVDPTSPFVVMAEAQALAANTYDVEALRTLEAVDLEGPYASVAFDSRLALYQRLNRDGEASDLAARAAQGSARATDHLRLGDILSQQHRYPEAAAAYTQALAAPDMSGAPERWGLLMLKGSALAQAGDWAAAESVLRDAIRLAPNQAVVLNYLGYSLLERREKIPEALDLILRASKLKPDDAAITDSLGWAYYLTGDFDRAVTALEAATLADPIEPTIAEHMGDAYWRAGRRIEARYSWRTSLLTAEAKDVDRLTEKVDIGLTDKTQAR